MGCRKVRKNLDGTVPSNDLLNPSNPHEWNL